MEELLSAAELEEARRQLAQLEQRITGLQAQLQETQEDDLVTELRSRLANLGAIREQLATVVSTGRINLSSTAAGVGNSRDASAAGNSRDASCQAGDSPAVSVSEEEEEEEEGDGDKLMEEEEGEEEGEEEDYFAGEEEEEKDDTAEVYNDEDESEVVLRSVGHLPDSNSITEKAKVRRRRNALLGLEN